LNKLNILLQEISEYETKKEIKIDIQRKILDFEENSRELETKRILPSKYKNIWNILMISINAATFFLNWKIGLKELKNSIP